MRSIITTLLLVFGTALQLNAQPTAYGFLDFKGKISKQKAEITWITTQELNLSHFNLERSYNGFDFQRIASPAALGTTLGQNVYRFTDPVASSSGENIFYRLRCVDVNGNISFSSVLRLQSGTPQPRLTVMGSGSIRSELHLNITSINEQPAMILVSNQQGIVVKQQPVKLFNGSFTQPVDISTLAKGMYFVSIHTGDEILQQRFIKQ